MNRLLIVATFVISSVPLYAQAPDPAKLKADAQNVVTASFGRLADVRCLAFDIFDALPLHTVAAAYT